MRKDIVYALGLALALPCAGAWAQDNAANSGNAAGAGTELQAPAPANPGPGAAQDQTAPNAAPEQAPPNAAPPDQAPPIPQNQEQNPAQPNPQDQQNQQPNNPAPPNEAPPTAAPQNLTPPAQEPPNAAPMNQPQSSVPGEPGTAATPTYYSPLQEFQSKQVDEIGELSQELTQFKAAKRPDAVMALYHMIRDHRLLADAAGNILARRGDVSTPTITPMPIAGTPDEMLQQDIQGHQQTASQLQQMASNANSPEEQRLYQRALNVTNQHLNWLNSLSQGQQVSLGFFGPTTPLGVLSGTTAVATAAAAPGYPQPVITRTAGFQQQYAGQRSMRTRRARRYRSGRYGQYHRRYRSSRTYRSRRMYGYR